MLKIIKNSELILNPDKTIYHLHLRPENIAPTVILVGDPDRVDKVSRYFDSIDFKQHKREFKTHTGYLSNKRITVISTGIGSDNIDIVLNELDALVNIDFENRKTKSVLTSLNIIRIGTSGTIQKNIPIDSFLLSNKGLDLSGMLNNYNTEEIRNRKYEKLFCKHTNWSSEKAHPILVDSCEKLYKQLYSESIYSGITATFNGFYAPQGRTLRLNPKDENLIAKIEKIRLNKFKVTNFEMETSAIFGLSKLLGHKSSSINAILANRINGNFSKSPDKTIDKLIQYCLYKLIDHRK
tara:strand:+ start:803 stop:1687 length:885 start_codon:yes stop_codon:yes gene_type:complete